MEYLVFNSLSDAKQALAIIDVNRNIPRTEADKGYFMNTWADIISLSNGKFAFAMPSNFSNQLNVDYSIENVNYINDNFNAEFTPVG
jgi:hypothetical protein